jgi:hypothetical protein
VFLCTDWLCIVCFTCYTGDLDRELVSDGFTLSRLLGGESGSPTNTNWDSLNESLTEQQQQREQQQQQQSSGQQQQQQLEGGFVAVTTAASGAETSTNDTVSYESSGNSNNSSTYEPTPTTGPGAPGYRPWEADQQQQQQPVMTSGHFAMTTPHVVTTTPVIQVTSRAMHIPPPAYYHQQHQQQQHHYGQQPHLPSFQSQFHFSDLIPPPNTQVRNSSHTFLGSDQLSCP